MTNRILIVDDDPAQRRILEETVKRFGFEAKTTNSGEHALEILSSPNEPRSISSSSISSCRASTAWACSSG